MGVKLKNTLSSVLSSSSGTKLGSLVCVGSGGPFDVAEGNTSMVLNLGAGKESASILVDCGPTVYSTLCGMDMTNEVDAILITSTAESCMGSLVTMVSHMHYYRLHKGESGIIKVICAEHLEGRIKDYLHLDGASSMVEFVRSLPEVDITFFETDKSNSAFIMKFGTSKTANILYSGNMNSVLFDMLEKNWPSTMESLENDPNNVIVFHEASLIDDPSTCYYERLSSWSERFKNFFVFGHSKKEGSDMIFNERYMRSMSTRDGNNEFNIEKTLSL